MHIKAHYTVNEKNAKNNKSILTFHSKKTATVCTEEIHGVTLTKVNSSTVSPSISLDIYEHESYDSMVERNYC